MARKSIVIRGAKQNNLKNLDIKIPLNRLVVVTGVSGSGKSSLAFDTVYAEGQRRYVETFSPYARQFLDRMDRPKVDQIDGIPPAIAIDQANPVRTSRSTVGTMTELNDHLKLLFARASQLYCHGCGHEVVRDNADSIYNRILVEHTLTNFDMVMVSFNVVVPSNFTSVEIQGFLEQNGYTRTLEIKEENIEVIQDRIRFTKENHNRIIEALEQALKNGHGILSVYPMISREISGPAWRFSNKLHCASCDIDYSPAQPSHFSFNSPLGACSHCRGFGRTIGINYGLVVPDQKKSLADGAVKPFQSPSYSECQDDLMLFARQRKIPTTIPWKDLSVEQQQWVLRGEGDFDEGLWYGVDRFFKWLEGKSYKMHIRVLLSKYRSYDKCSTCNGSRLKPLSLLWRIATEQDDELEKNKFHIPGLDISEAVMKRIPGLSIHDVMMMPIDTTLALFNRLQLPNPFNEATQQLLDEIRSRLRYLVDVGLGYLTLDRQSRTLSGGEVQRINLTTALGTSLVNTLFVLDEPSIGLHSRDVERLIGILNRLRDAGNSLLVVEHDPEIMRQADYILDIGPGPGNLGGKKVFFGTPAELLRRKNSLTGQYLNGSKQVLPQNYQRKSLSANTPWLKIVDAYENNLKHIDVQFPLGHICCLTGVSGSGKSTLLHDVLYAGVQKIKGQSIETMGAHGQLLGTEHFSSVHIVDQSPIGKTTRSNPVSYVGAWEEIRKLFAIQPLSRERKYTPGTFSFNSGNGRCPSCSGNGFEHIEMQFLSDVYIRCSECNGTRYRKEILDISLLPAIGPYQGEAKNIAAILEMPVSQAIEFFSDQKAIISGLQPLMDVGLGYIQLGQPVPTLSGGEAQRLKLAGHLAKTQQRNKTSEPMLFLFDEPSTGLHFHDIQVLLKAFVQLREAGHSLIIIEHNLDIIAAADWIVDLGPEGGSDGGEVIANGSPQDFARAGKGYTASALREYFNPTQSIRPSKEKKSINLHLSANQISIRHAREHNLKNINLDIPRDKMTVITGLSGSGKSTIAFDILFAEGQRRYLESLNAYARQFVQPAGRADIDAIYGIPPTVAIEQRTSRGGFKSTVATVTEIYHFLRLLYVKLGVQYCPKCDIPIQQQSIDQIIDRISQQYRKKQVTLLSPMVTNRKGIYNELAAWAAAKGYPNLVVDGDVLPTDNWPKLDRYKEHNIDLPVAKLKISPLATSDLRNSIDNALTIGKGVFKIQTDKGKPQLFSIHRACTSCGQSFDELDPRLFSYNSKHGACETCQGNGYISEFQDEEDSYEVELADSAIECPKCHGNRLNETALAVRFKGLSISQLTAINVEEAFQSLSKMRLDQREKAIAEDIISEIISRLRFLQEVGLGYLDLSRAAPTLSGGESQRIRLAAQLGTNLQGVCYILDEPTIGLHPHDNKMLLASLKRLEKKGNTLVIVEHDEDTIRMAEHVVDLGPGAGKRGGKIVAQGSIKSLQKNKDSITGQYFANPIKHPLLGKKRDSKVLNFLEIEDASLHNLKNLNLKLPLNRLVVVTGISGSGKSTLVRHVLLKNLKNQVGKNKSLKNYYGCSNINGINHISRILEVDQTPIGKTPRSCPATYIGFWDKIRKLFANTPEAQIRGYSASRFSFNTKDGCCPACDGQGTKRIEMSFLPNVSLKCDVCNGRRFTPDTLEINWRGKNIADILEMDIDEAVEFFSSHKSIHVSLKLLQDIGLGYLTLGQASPTLSGGEAQRIKLVTELSKSFLAKARQETDLVFAKSKQHTLFILDEPTVGLHMADVEKLIHIFHQLVDAGNSLIIIEHNMDIMAEADWLVDMGPQGGNKGGRVVAQGSPEKIAGKRKQSKTAMMLAPFLSGQ